MLVKLRIACSFSHCCRSASVLGEERSRSGSSNCRQGCQPSLHIRSPSITRAEYCRGEFSATFQMCWMLADIDVDSGAMKTWLKKESRSHQVSSFAPRIFHSLAHDADLDFRYRTISMDSYIHWTLPFSLSMRRQGTWLLPPPAIRSVLLAG